MIEIARKASSIPTVNYSKRTTRVGTVSTIKSLRLLVPNGATKNEHFLRGELIRNLIEVGSILRHTGLEEVN